MPEKRLANGEEARAIKRQKYAAKQQRAKELETERRRQDAWIIANGAVHATLANVQALKDGDDGEISRLLQPYCDLKESSGELSGENLVVAEGTETVRLLLQQSTDDRLPIAIKSVFIKPSVMFEPPVSLVDEVERAWRSGCRFKVIIGEDDVQSAVAGFPIARGALACGVVPLRDEKWLMEYLQNRHHTKGYLRLVAVDGLSDTSNLGSIIRSASAFGIDAILASRDSCDAWYRRAVRVSMGHVFRVPVVRVNHLADSLRALASILGVSTYAAVVNPNAHLVLDHVGSEGDIASSWCCVLGNEANGISQSVIDACTSTIRIDMDERVDSLSVPVAAGILLHGLKTRAQGSDEASNR